MNENPSSLISTCQLNPKVSSSNILSQNGPLKTSGIYLHTLTPYRTTLAATSRSVNPATNCDAKNSSSQGSPFEYGLDLLSFDTSGVGLSCYAEESGAGAEEVCSEEYLIFVGLEKVIFRGFHDRPPVP